MKEIESNCQWLHFKSTPTSFESWACWNNTPTSMENSESVTNFMSLHPYWWIKRPKERKRDFYYNIEQYCQWKRWKSYYGELETTHCTQCLVIFNKFIFPVKVNLRKNWWKMFLNGVWCQWMCRKSTVPSNNWNKCEFCNHYDRIKVAIKEKQYEKKIICEESRLNKLHFVVQLLASESNRNYFGKKGFFLVKPITKKWSIGLFTV